MIVKMKKVTVFAGLAHADAALRTLRSIGVLHVQLRNDGAGNASDIEQRIERAREALRKIGSTDKPETLLMPPEEIVNDILKLNDDRERLLVAREEVEARSRWYDRWGKVSLGKIRELADVGVAVRLYNATADEYEELVNIPRLYKVGEEGKLVLLAQVALPADDVLELPEEQLPAAEVRELLDEHYRLDESLSEVNSRLAFLGNYENVLQDYVACLKVELEFSQVRDSLARSESICHLQGFAPVDATDELRQAAKTSGWAITFEEPAEEDDVPTLTRNPKWVRIVNPVLSFLGTVPGYNELDISMWFLLFFALFVALLVGDAGYGFIYLFATIAARLKFKKAPKEPFVLMYVLSGSTILWGVLSGTWFGSEAIANLPVLRSLVVPAISSFDLIEGGFNDNQALLIKICFIIGAVHLTLAHILAGFKICNSPKALAEVGWICIIWGLYCLAATLVLNEAFPAFGGYLIAIGSLVALVFTNFQKNILKGVLESLIQFPLALIGGFSDVVSYLRLFAVGYTSLVLASSFNQMALGDGIKGPLAAIGAGAILFAGHTLNIVLAGMGVLVHGIRLKMLEFSGHLGNEWSGRQYEPFEEKDGAVSPQAG